MATISILIEIRC